jgi:hypothetical protein
MSSFPLTNSYFSRWLLHHQPVRDINGIFMGYEWGYKKFVANQQWGFSYDLPQSKMNSPMMYLRLG